MFRIPNRANRESGTAVSSWIHVALLAWQPVKRWLCILFFFLCAPLWAQSPAPAETVDYLLSPGDRISIHVYGEPELTFADLPIPNDGMITFPFIGEVQAAGKSESELAGRIAALLKDGYLLQPQVTVTVSGYRPIYVGGGVMQPGKKSFDVGMDVEKVIALSGGFADNADRTVMVIQRTEAGGKEEFDATLSTPVQPGDIVTVGTKQKIEKPKQYFYLYGEVAKPGQYEYRDGLSVEKAIVIAGGFGMRASKKKITISRGDPVEKIKRVPLSTPVEPGDIITIGASLF